MREKYKVHEPGTGTQMLIDDHMVDDIYRVIRLPEMPIKYLNTPIFPRSGTVIYDEEEKVFKMWYGVPSEIQYVSRGAYAVSEDGIHWEKPKLGIVEYEGTKNNNLLDTNGFGAVLKDPADPDPERRYKMMTKRKVGSKGGRAFAAFSPDGIHWQDHPRESSIIRGSGDGNGRVVYDERLGKYINFRRPTILACPKPTTPDSIGFPDNRVLKGTSGGEKPKDPPAGIGFPSAEDFTHHAEAEDYIHRYLRQAPYVNTKALRIRQREKVGCNRRIARAESDDFINWTEPEVIIRPDTLDSPKLYSMTVSIYRGMYIGFLQVYNSWGHRRAPGCPQEQETMDVQLAFSRDGRRWERLANRPVFLPRGRIGSFDGGMISSVDMVEYGDEIRFYYTGSSSSHNITPHKRGLGLARLPLERLVARKAGDELGALITKPFRLEGKKLEINANAAGGLIKVEVTDPIGKPIEGFQVADSVEIRQDDLSIQVEWRNGRRLNELAGEAIRLRFFMWQSRLYSLTLKK